MYPPLIAATGDVVSEPLGALTLTLALLLAVRAWRASSPATWGSPVQRSGWPCSCADLLIVPFLLSGFLLAALLRSRRHRTQAALAFLGAAVLIIAPWGVYASTRTGHPTPVTDAGASALFIATYLPGGGTLFGLKGTPLADQARAGHPAGAHVPDTTAGPPTTSAPGSWSSTSSWSSVPWRAPAGVF